MLSRIRALLAISLVAAIAGCSKDAPAEYGRQRPPVDSLVEDDRGLQSKDVISATDLLARDLLQQHELRNSPTQWTVVVDRIEDRTLDRHFNYNYDIFLERFRSNLSQLGQGQIRLIENKQRFQNIRSRELDEQRGDEFGQGSGARTGAAPVQPDFALYGKALDMPNRATNYYQIQFDLVNLQTREQVWSRTYEVKVAR